MNWVAIDTAIGNNPKTWALAERLRTVHGLSTDSPSIVTVVGHLTLLFGQVMESRPNGKLDGVPDKLIENWARWEGPAGAFAKEFRRLFAAKELITGWDEWNGRLHEKREKDKERKRLSRMSSGLSTDSPRPPSTDSPYPPGVDRPTPPGAERRGTDRQTDLTDLQTEKGSSARARRASLPDATASSSSKLNGQEPRAGIVRQAEIEYARVADLVGQNAVTDAEYGAWSARTKAAWRAVGGAVPIRNVGADQVVWLRREWVKAYTEAAEG